MQGELKGFDQTTNVILSGSTERVFSTEEGVEEVPLGVYIIRGDNIVRSSRPSTESLKCMDGKLIQWRQTMYRR